MKADFTSDVQAGCSPVIVNFKDASTGGATAWKWDFGNGNRSQIQNPVAIYDKPGKYTVTLTVQNASGENTSAKTGYITIYEKPVLSFTENNTSGCPPLNVSFSDNSSAGQGNTITSRLWDFGNGTTSTEQKPVGTYLNSGQFKVTLKLTNDKGCFQTLTKNKLVNVLDKPKSSFINSKNLCVVPAVVKFTNTSTGSIAGYEWDFGNGGKSTEKHPVHTYNKTGTYTVTLITKGINSCSDTLRLVNYIAVGNARTDFSAPDIICSNSPVTFRNTSVPAPKLSSWAFSDGTTSTETNARKTFTKPGVYTVELTNTYDDCSDVISKTVTVKAGVTGDFSAQFSSKCAPLPVKFTSQTEGAVSWLWNFGDGSTSTQQNPSYTYTNAGTYSVSLELTSSDGCKKIISKENFITVDSIVSNISGLPASGCAPIQVSPRGVLSTPTNITSYSWNFGNGTTSTNPNPTAIYTVPGVYTVSLTITTASGCKETIIKRDAVKTGTKPSVDFSAEPRVVCGDKKVAFKNLSTGSELWIWSFGDGGTSGLQDPTHQYEDTGKFSVTLIANNNGCIDSMTKADYITIYPPIARFDTKMDCNNPLTVAFVNESLGAETFLWDFGDGTTDSNSSPTHTFSKQGNYAVSLTAYRDSCKYTTIKNIYIIGSNNDFFSPDTLQCLGQNTRFNSNTLLADSALKFIYDFGDGAILDTSSTPEVIHKYKKVGTYSVSLKVISPNGCNDTINKINYIKVGGVKGDFSVSIPEKCSKNDSTVFTDLSVVDSSNQIVKWKWDFGDNTIETFTEPVFKHSYSSTDSFDIQLTVTDVTGCADTVTKRTYIPAWYAKAAFELDSLACVDTELDIKNVSRPLSSKFLWDIGGKTFTDTEPVHAFQQLGKYKVSLKMENEFGCRDSLSKDVNVAKPRVNFSVSDTLSACVPFDVKFTQQTENISRFTWEFGDGSTSVEKDPFYFYTQPGVFNARLIGEATRGCADTASVTIRLVDASATDFSYGPLIGCNPLLVNLRTDSVHPRQYIWDFGDGNVINTEGPSTQHTYETPGKVVPKIILDFTDNCKIVLTGKDPISTTGAIAKFGIDNKILCDSGFVQLSDSTIHNDPITSYIWDFGDGTTSTEANPQHYYKNPGQYSISLTINTEQGCTDSVQVPNVVNVATSPPIAIAGDSVACLNTPMFATGVDSLNGSVTSWQWNFPNNRSFTTQTPPKQTYSSVGLHTISLTAKNSYGCTTTTEKTVRVLPLPTADLPAEIRILAGTSANIPATYSEGVIRYLWDPATTLNCLNCPQPIATPPSNLTYQVTFTDQNGCKNTAETRIVLFCKEDSYFFPNTFSPNGDGSNDIFYPRGNGIYNIQSLRIFNRWGEVVFENRNFAPNDANAGWNGTYKGIKAVPGVYIFQAEVICASGEVFKINGNVALIQ